MAAVAIRGTGAVSASNSTYTLPFPAGTLAGDLAIICGHHANDWNPGAGWTQIDYSSGPYVTGGAYSRVLTAADITAGSATIGTTGAYSGGFAIITIVGNYPIKNVISARSTGPGPTVGGFNCSFIPTSNDLEIYFGGSRGANTVTINRGTLQRQATDSVKSSIALYTETGLAAAPVLVYNYPGSSDGIYQIVLNVGTPTSGGGGGGGAYTFLG